MNAARAEAALRDLEATAFAEQEVLDGDLDILEQHLGVAVRRVVIAEHRQHPLDCDAWSVERHEDLRLLLVARIIRAGLAHQDRDLATRIADARRPPLAAVD